MVNTLRSRIRKAAIQNPELRPSLVPLLKQGRGSQDELGWAASEIEGALARLRDVVTVLEMRGGGQDPEANTSLADDHREAAEAADLIVKLSKLPAKLRRIR